MRPLLIAAVIALVLIAGCTPTAPPAEPAAAPPIAEPPAPLTDETILQQYDDGLDAALDDLAAIES